MAADGLPDELTTDAPTDPPEQKDSHLTEALAALLALLSMRFGRAYVAFLHPLDGVLNEPHTSPVDDLLSPSPHWHTTPSPYAPSLPRTLFNDYAKTAATGQAGVIADVLAKRANDEIAKAIALNETPEQIKARIVSVIESDALLGTWSESLSTALLGNAAAQVAQQLNAPSLQWLTQRDNQVRDTHAAMNGQIREVGQRFESPSGATALHPGGFGIGAEDFGCRCQVVPTGATPHANTWSAFESLRSGAVSDLRDSIAEIMKSHEEELMTGIASMHAMHFELQAMALDMPTDAHPNKVPFSGVLTRVDQPSDKPPGGSDGKCVLIPSKVAEAAISSLLGMAVDYAPGFAAHDSQQKIGLITSADVVGSELRIGGYFYGLDFPEQVAFIKANKDKLGFSYEAQVATKSMQADPIEVTHCVFTGAAVLFKDKAAYTTTSITAAADKETTMDEQLKAALDAINASVAGLATEVATIKANAAETSLKAGSVQHLVKPHADNLRAAADKMEAAGIGMTPKRGHVAVLNHMADSMEAAACTGDMPSSYSGASYYDAAAGVVVEDPKVKALEAQLKASGEAIDALTTVVNDVKAKAFTASEAPVRTTASPAVMSLLAKAGIQAEGAKKMSVSEVDEMLGKQGLSGQQRIAAKLNLQANGLIA